MIERTLVVNADDFGQSLGVTRGIIEAHERGIVTSASLMVLWPGSTTAAAYARAQPALSIGLHVDLGEWIWSSGTWRAVHERVDAEHRHAVEREVRAQLERYRDLLGRDPTHLDSHQHVHRREPVRSVLIDIANELGVPLRHVTPGIRYCGDFYGQTAIGEPLPDLISVARLVSLLSSLPRRSLPAIPATLTISTRFTRANGASKCGHSVPAKCARRSQRNKSISRRSRIWRW